MRHNAHAHIGTEQLQTTLACSSVGWGKHRDADGVKVEGEGRACRMTRGQSAPRVGGGGSPAPNVHASIPLVIALVMLSFLRYLLSCTAPQGTISL